MSFQMDQLCGILKGTLGTLVLLLATEAHSADCRIAVIGDSLSASYGLDLADGFPARLEQSLQQEGYTCAVLDFGVSGDTSSGGLARLDWTLADAPSHVIIELGANDGLRGLPPEEMASNLDQIMTRLRAEQLPVLLTGMLAPPNLGRPYTTAFEAVFAELAEKHDVPLYPFFLEGVASVPELNLSDGIHPNAQGVDVIVEGILPTVTAWLDGSS